jgi:hypothetical protein
MQSANAASRAAPGEVAIAASGALVADGNQSADSPAWWAQDWSELQQKADSLTLDAQGLSPLVTTMAKVLPDGSRQQNDQIFVKNMREINVPTASGILAVRDGLDNGQRLACSRVWQHIHLWGATRGAGVPAPVPEVRAGGSGAAIGMIF